MPIRVNGKLHKTITEAAEELGIAPNTLRNYIRYGKFTAPSKVWQGTKEVSYFTEPYLLRARNKLAEMRKKIKP